MIKVLLTGPKPSGKGGVSMWVGVVLDYLNTHETEIELKLAEVKKSANLTHLLPTYKRIWYGIKDYCKLLVKVNNELKNEKYDALHITSSGKTGIIRDWLYMTIARKYKVRPIVHYHCGTIPEQLKKGGFISMLLRRVAKHSDIIVLDEASRISLANEGFHNVYKIGNPYNKVIDSIITNQVERNPNEILFVGHMVHEKGIRELLQVMCSFRDMHLKCFGPENASIKNEITDFINQNNLSDNIEICGIQPPETIYKEMFKAGLFVLPTYTEGFPFVIVEAMACGCPIISTPVGAIEEMLTTKEGLQGYLVPVKDTSALKDQLDKCLTNRDDLNCKAFKAKVKAKEEYSVDSIMYKLIALWSK